MGFRITCSTSYGRMTVGTAPDRSAAASVAAMAESMGYRDVRIEEDRHRNPLIHHGGRDPIYPISSHSIPSAALPLTFSALLLPVPGDRKLDRVRYVGERVILDLGPDVVHYVVVDVDGRAGLGCHS